MGVRLGAELRHRRKRAGLTMADLEEATGYSESMLSLVERGRWPGDPDRVVNAYAEALGTTPRAIWRTALERED